MRTLVFCRREKLFWLGGISFLFLVLLLSSCVAMAPQPSQIILGVNHEPALLNIKFAQVTLPRMRMWNALCLLSDTINHVPEKIARFSWGVRVEPNNFLNFPEETNPWVSIDQKNTTLRQVLDELCRQAGWTYEECAIGILFISPPKKICGLTVLEDYSKLAVGSTKQPSRYLDMIQDIDVPLGSLFIDRTPSPSEPPCIIVGSHNTQKNLLDTKLTQVTLPRMRMLEALKILGEAIDCDPKEAPRFHYNIFVNANTYRGLPEPINPWVSIYQKNTTVEQLLTELCKQAGWSFCQDGSGIVFTMPPKKILGFLVVHKTSSKLSQNADETNQRRYLDVRVGIRWPLLSF